MTFSQRLAIGASTGLVALSLAATAAFGYIVYTPIITSEIANGAITTAKIANGAVTNAKLASNAVTGAKIANGTITAADLGNSSVGKDEIEEDAVGTDEVIANSLGGEDLADESVGTGEIVDGTVLGEDLAADISIVTTGTLDVTGTSTLGPLTATGAVDFSGASSLKVPTVDIGTVACDGGNEGGIGYYEGHIYVCDGSDWLQLDNEIFD